MSAIISGFTQTITGLTSQPYKIRQGIYNGTKEIIELLKDHMLNKGSPGERIGKHRGEPLYWTGALRRSVTARMYGKVSSLGGTITGGVYAGTIGRSSVWYAYKVHEIGRGFRAKLKPIPFMRLAWFKIYPRVRPIMTNKIYEQLGRGI